MPRARIIDQKAVERSFNKIYNSTRKTKVQICKEVAKEFGCSAVHVRNIHYGVQYKPKN